jgi:hypothetical protein
MKRWRVGSLSMGLVLLAFGILLLVSLIVKINVINIVYTLSPIVLICLGIEILLHLFVKNSDDVKIKYDFLSIIFISAVLFIGTCVYALTGFIGLFETKQEMFSAFGIRNETICNEYSKEFDNADEIAVFGTFQDIQVLSADSDKIKVEYYVKLSTSDKGYAESVVEKVIKFETADKRIQMISNPVITYNDQKLGYPVIACTIYLPKDKIIDLSQCRYNYDIAIDNRINTENIIR